MAPRQAKYRIYGSVGWNPGDAPSSKLSRGASGTPKLLTIFFPPPPAAASCTARPCSPLEWPHSRSLLSLQSLARQPRPHPFFRYHLHAAASVFSSSLPAGPCSLNCRAHTSTWTPQNLPGPACPPPCSCLDESFQPPTYGQARTWGSFLKTSLLHHHIQLVPKSGDCVSKSPIVSVFFPPLGLASLLPGPLCSLLTHLPSTLGPPRTASHFSQGVALAGRVSYPCACMCLAVFV